MGHGSLPVTLRAAFFVFRLSRRRKELMNEKDTCRIFTGNVQLVATHGGGPIFGSEKENLKHSALLN